MVFDRITIELFISSKNWKNSKLELRTEDEFIKSLKFKNREFFFEKEGRKVNIDFGLGKIQVPSKIFVKELGKFLEENNSIQQT